MSRRAPALLLTLALAACGGSASTKDTANLFLLPNPQRWQRALAPGGSAKCLILMSFLLRVLWSAKPPQLDLDFTR